jgi:leader peptidase (prepilin peptidase)/N-methyltransferase
MLEREWAAECRQLLELASEDQPSTEKYNLLVPRSHCPKCKTPIGSFENIPVISYLLKKGKCQHCGKSISIQYPLIEIITAILTGYVAFEFGFTWQTVAAILLIWGLIALAVIDFKTTLLPDNITLPLLWLGIVVNYFGVFCTLENSVLGAIFGYMSLWTVFQVFKIVTGKEGMGFGDFKLLALLGAWLGWQYLLPIILISSVVGSVIGIALLATKALKRDIPIPFGPYLVLGGLICLFWGETVQSTFNFI